MMLSMWNGVGALILRCILRDSTLSNNGGKTGLSFSSLGLIISTIADNESTPTVYTQAGSTIETVTTLGTFAAPTASKCRFRLVDDTNHPGLYEIQIANARWGVSGARYIVVTISGVSGATQENYLVQVPSVNLNDSTNSATPAIPGLIFTTALTESYAALNAAPTLAQAIFEIVSILSNRSISSTVLTTKKIDGTTSAMTFTLDSATAPTSQVRAS